MVLDIYLKWDGNQPPVRFQWYPFVKAVAIKDPKSVQLVMVSVCILSEKDNMSITRKSFQSSHVLLAWMNVT